MARSTFRSQKWKKLRGLEHFWTFRCRFAFPERGCILEHQIFKFAEMILRDRCSTSHVAGAVL